MHENTPLTHNTKHQNQILTQTTQSLKQTTSLDLPYNFYSKFEISHPNIKDYNSYSYPINQPHHQTYTTSTYNILHNHKQNSFHH